VGGEKTMKKIYSFITAFAIIASNYVSPILVLSYTVYESNVNVLDVDDHGAEVTLENQVIEEQIKEEKVEMEGQELEEVDLDSERLEAEHELGDEGKKELEEASLDTDRSEAEHKLENEGKKELETELYEELDLSNQVEVNVGSFVDLQREINNASSGQATIITITNNINFNASITINDGRNITIRSNATPDSPHVLTRTSLRHFVVTGNNSSLTLEDGLTLNGVGGVSVENGANFTMNGGTIQGVSNSAGAVGVVNGTFIMTGGMVSYNNTTGIRVTQNSNFTMTGGTISHNVSSSNGGGIYSNSPNPIVIENATIEHNVTSGAGGGGGIVVERGSLELKNTVVRHNSTTRGAGGGILAWVFVTIENSNIYNNQSAANGGGINLNTTAFHIIDSEIKRNTAANNGGGIFASAIVQTNLNQSISNVIFEENRASSSQRPSLGVETVFERINNNSSSIYTHPMNNYDIGWGNIAPSPHVLSIAETLDDVQIKINEDTNIDSIEVFRDIDVKLEAIVPMGYEVTEWTSAGGGTFSNRTGTSTIFTMPNNSVLINAEVKWVGTVRILDLPTELEFRNTVIQDNMMIIPRIEAEWGFTVEDTRLEGEPWSLLVTAGPLVSEDRQHEIEGALVFKKDDEVTPITSHRSTPIIKESEVGSRMTEISWQDDEGLLLYMRPSQVRATTYTTTLTWTIQYGPLNKLVNE